MYFYLIKPMTKFSGKIRMQILRILYIDYQNITYRITNLLETMVRKEKKTSNLNLQGHLAPRKDFKSSPKHLLLLIAISFLGALLYFSTYNYEFSADDGMYSYFNSATKEGLYKTGDLFKYGSMHFLNISPINSGAYRPFTLFTFALEKQLTGEFKPVYGHLFNILLYFLVLLSIGSLLSALFKTKGYPSIIPLMILLLYALHPLHTEVVASIKSRDTLLSALFAFWAINRWLLNAGKSNSLDLGKTGVLFFIALLSKEEALTMIAVVFLISYYFLNQNVYTSLKSTSPFLIAGASYLIIRQIVLDSPTSNYDNLLNNVIFSANGPERIATNLYIYLYYIKLLIFPHPLSWDYSFNQVPVKTIADGWVLMSAVFFSALLVYTVRNFKNRKITGFGILVYLTTFSIYSNFTPSITIGSTIGERFMFIPSLGFCTVLVYGIYQFLIKLNIIKTNQVLLVISLVIGIIYTAKSINRIPVWQDNLTLCYSGIRDAPKSWRTHMLLGEELRLKALRLKSDTVILKANRDSAIKTFEAAVYHYKLGYSIINNQVKQLSFLQGLGECYLNLKDTASAKGAFLRAAQNPKLFFAQFKLGMLSFSERNYSAAAGYYKNALKADLPDFISTYKNLGASYLALKDYRKAIEAYEKALEYGSGADVKANLAMLYSNIGDFDKADKLMTENTKMTDNEKLFNNLMNAGIGAYNLGKYDEAIKYFRECDPLFEKYGGHSKFPDFLNSWARSCLNTNQIVEAKTIFQRVISTDPKNYYAMMNLGNIAFNNESNYVVATSYFIKCLKTNSPDFFLTYSNLGTLFLVRNQHDKAIENYENALKYGSSQLVIRNLFLLYKSKGNQQKMAYYKALITNS